jgi:hypothetical protein
MRIPILCAGLLAGALNGCAPAPRPAARAPDASPVTMYFDYAGAEAIVDALERDSLSQADVDSLLRIHGVRRMVENVTRFVPQAGVPQFRDEIRTFARTKRGGEFNRFFQFSDAWRERGRVRALIGSLRSNEPAIVRESLAQLDRYRPDTGPLRIGVYLVAGGVSDGFAFEDGSRAFYANLVRAGGDYNGVVWNAVHEAYHVMQMAAQQRSGHFVAWISDASAPPVERLVAATLLEGTANFVSDPTRSTAPGTEMEQQRARYARNAQPAQVAASFARFDRVLKELREGRMTWEAASGEGLSGDPHDAFYFVGYEMAKAIDRHCGSACIGRLFSQPPVEFFRQYVALSREHPDVPGRFSRETEAYLTTSLP